VCELCCGMQNSLCFPLLYLLLCCMLQVVLPDVPEYVSDSIEQFNRDMLQQNVNYVYSQCGFEGFELTGHRQLPLTKMQFPLNLEAGVQSGLMERICRNAVQACIKYVPDRIRENCIGFTSVFLCVFLGARLSQ
jgi:hypothetical protein